MAFFNDLFNSFTNQQATPQQTIVPTSQLLGQGYSTATGLAPQVAALNQAYQPIITGNQLSSESQVFGPSANLVQRGAYDSILNELNLGNSVSPELQDLITTNTLQGLGSSGIGTADAGKIFGARSLLSAGLDLGRSRRQEALNASGMLPSSRMAPGTIGVPDPLDISGMIEQETAARDNYANIVEDTRRKNFSSLVNTGSRILGTVAGGIIGAYTGNPAGGAIAGGEIGGRVFGQSGVAGMQQPQQQQQAGGGGLGFFTSLLNGSGGMGRYSGGGGQYYTNSRGDLMQSSKAIPVNLA